VYTPLLLAALSSARQNSDVVPRVVLHPNADVPRLRSAIERFDGITVLTHVTSHDEALASGANAVHPEVPGEANLARGVFVRFDVPLLAAAETLNKPFDWVAAHLAEAAAAMEARPMRDNVCLYTDADIIFLPGATLLADVASGALQVPRVFSASSELDVQDYDAFNSGVMFINVAGFLRIAEDLWRISLQDDFKCMLYAWDQGCLQKFARERRGLIEPLAPQFNWRPYLLWPKDTVPTGERLRIEHFHGPKPKDIIAQLVVPSTLGGGEVQGYAGYSDLIKRNVQGYLQALSNWLAVVAAT
jgi:hypothetical protein